MEKNTTEVVKTDTPSSGSGVKKQTSKKQATPTKVEQKTSATTAKEKELPMGIYGKKYIEIIASKEYTDKEKITIFSKSGLPLIATTCNYMTELMSEVEKSSKLPLTATDAPSVYYGLQNKIVSNFKGCLKALKDEDFALYIQVLSWFFRAFPEVLVPKKLNRHSVTNPNATVAKVYTKFIYVIHTLRNLGDVPKTLKEVSFQNLFGKDNLLTSEQLSKFSGFYKAL